MQDTVTSMQFCKYMLEDMPGHLHWLRHLTFLLYSFLPTRIGTLIILEDLIYHEVWNACELLPSLACLVSKVTTICYISLGLKIQQANKHQYCGTIW